MEHANRDHWRRLASAWAAVQVVAALASIGGHALTPAAQARYCGDLQRQMQVDRRVAGRVEVAVGNDANWRDRWCVSAEQSVRRKEARERVTGVSEELADFVRWREHDRRERERQHIRQGPGRVEPSAELRRLRDQNRTSPSPGRRPPQARVDRARRRRQV